MKKFYYYAELNDQDVCVRIVSDTTKKVGSTRHIEIPEYNPTVVFKKWLGDQWSAESYEPSVDTILQDKVDAFEVVVSEQNLQITTMKESNNVLNIALESQRLLLDEMLFEILPGLMG